MLIYLFKLGIDKDVIPHSEYYLYDLEGLMANFMYIDSVTLGNLELLQNNDNGGERGTLYYMLNNCYTPFGKRKLLEWICHPLKDVKSINDRLDAVEFLLDNPEYNGMLVYHTNIALCYLLL